MFNLPNGYDHCTASITSFSPGKTFICTSLQCKYSSVGRDDANSYMFTLYSTGRRSQSELKLALYCIGIVCLNMLVALQKLLYHRTLFFLRLSFPTAFLMLLKISVLIFFNFFIIVLLHHNILLLLLNVVFSLRRIRSAMWRCPKGLLSREYSFQEYSLLGIISSSLFVVWQLLPSCVDK